MQYMESQIPEGIHGHLQLFSMTTLCEKTDMNETQKTQLRVIQQHKDFESTNVSTGADYLEFRANGIKHKGLGGGGNDSGDGGAYLIMAFADVPFKYANAHG